MSGGTVLCENAIMQCIVTTMIATKQDYQQSLLVGQRYGMLKIILSKYNGFVKRGEAQACASSDSLFCCHGEHTRQY